MIVRDKEQKQDLDDPREEIFQPDKEVKLKNTKVYIKEFEFMGGRLIAVYNPEIEEALMMESMETLGSYNPEEARYMGYSLIYHTTELSGQEVVRCYYEKDIVKLKAGGISAVSALEKLQPVYKVGLSSKKEGLTWSKIVTLTKEQNNILKLLDCSV